MIVIFLTTFQAILSARSHSLNNIFIISIVKGFAGRAEESGDLIGALEDVGIIIRVIRRFEKAGHPTCWWQTWPLAKKSPNFKRQYPAGHTMQAVVMCKKGE